MESYNIVDIDMADVVRTEEMYLQDVAHKYHASIRRIGIQCVYQMDFFDPHFKLLFDIKYPGVLTSI